MGLEKELGFLLIFWKMYAHSLYLNFNVIRITPWWDEKAVQPLSICMHTLLSFLRNCSLVSLIQFKHLSLLHFIEMAIRHVLNSDMVNGKKNKNISQKKQITRDHRYLWDVEPMVLFIHARFSLLCVKYGWMLLCHSGFGVQVMNSSRQQRWISCDIAPCK